MNPSKSVPSAIVVERAADTWMCSIARQMAWSGWPEGSTYEGDWLTPRGPGRSIADIRVPTILVTAILAVSDTSDDGGALVCAPAKPLPR